MRVPRGSVLLLSLAAFSCSGSGAPGNDLFNDGGTSATGGSSVALGGSASKGGAFGNEGGLGQGGAAAGATSAAGGTAHAAGGTATGGTPSGNGGSLSAGGTTAASGGTSSAGASMTGGVNAASGGTTTGGSSSGGAIANGGVGGVASGGTTASGGASGGQGSGGGKGMSCEMLRTQLSSYLDSAQACQRNQSQNTCSETVMTECGCQVPVNASNTAAITSYNSTLAQLEKQCPNVACAAVRCANPSNASCSGNGPGAGQCTTSPYQGGPGP